MNRVVITGLGAISGLGKNVNQIWQKLEKGESGIRPITILDMSAIRFKHGAEVPDYNPLEYFQEKELDLIDKFSQFILIATDEAVKDSGIDPEELKNHRTCIITGTSVGGQDSTDTAYLNTYKLNTRVPLFTIPRVMPNAGASQISMRYGIPGFAYTISTACASGNHAIGNAFWMIRNGICDRAIAGGSETPFSLVFLKAWEALRVVASDTCRPFSLGRQGMILGEGGAVLILESLEAAEKRNAKIYAEIIGFGMSSDAGHITKPNGSGAESAMKMALDDAKIDPSKIDYINAHGTGTTANDSMETAAIKNIFGDHARNLAISATKSMHGHLLGGTSALEAVITSLALKNQLIPPTANYVTPDPECDLDVVPITARKATINYAMSNAFAFGGLNAVLAFKKWE